MTAVSFKLISMLKKIFTYKLSNWVGYKDTSNTRFSIKSGGFFAEYSKLLSKHAIYFDTNVNITKLEVPNHPNYARHTNHIGSVIRWMGAYQELIS